jgi:hypothetical protein
MRINLRLISHPHLRLPLDGGGQVGVNEKQANEKYVPYPILRSPSPGPSHQGRGIDVAH